MDGILHPLQDLIMIGIQIQEQYSKVSQQFRHYGCHLGSHLNYRHLITGKKSGIQTFPVLEHRKSDPHCSHLLYFQYLLSFVLKPTPINHVDKHAVFTFSMFDYGG